MGVNPGDTTRTRAGDLLELATLAQQAGRADLAEAVARLRDSARDRLLLVYASLPPPAVMDALAPSAVLPLAAASERGWRAERLVLALAAGEILDAASLTAVDEIVLARPRGSSLVVLWGAEGLHDSEVLTRVERQAWRCLAKDPPTDPEGHRLVDHDVVLLARGRPPAGLEGRLAADASHLETWRAGSAPDFQALDRLAQLRLLAVIGRALEERDAREGVNHGQGGTAAAGRAGEVSEELERVRRRLAQDLDRGFETMTSRLRSEVNVLEKQIGAALSPLFARPVADEHERMARLAEADRRAARIGGVWARTMHRIVGEMLDEMEQAVADRMQPIEGELLPGCAGTGVSQTERVLHELRLRERGPRILGGPSGGGLGMSLDAVAQALPATHGFLRHENLLGAVVGAASMFALSRVAPLAVLGPFLPLLPPVGVVAGLVAGHIIGAQQNSADARVADSQARRAVARQLEEGAAALARGIAEERSDARRCLSKIFDQLAGTLGTEAVPGSARDGCDRQEEEGPIQKALRQLQALRTRLQA
jgi:hypothetical protein